MKQRMLLRNGCVSVVLATALIGSVWGPAALAPLINPLAPAVSESALAAGGFTASIEQIATIVRPAGAPVPYFLTPGPTAEVSLQVRFKFDNPKATPASVRLRLINAGIATPERAVHAGTSVDVVGAALIISNPVFAPLLPLLRSWIVNSLSWQRKHEFAAFTTEPNGVYSACLPWVIVPVNGASRLLVDKVKVNLPSRKHPVELQTTALIAVSGSAPPVAGEPSASAAPAGCAPPGVCSEQDGTAPAPPPAAASTPVPTPASIPASVTAQ